MNDFKLLGGFDDGQTDGRTDERTDIGGSRVAFATEKRWIRSDSKLTNLVLRVMGR